MLTIQIWKVKLRKGKMEEQILDHYPFLSFKNTLESFLRVKCKVYSYDSKPSSYKDNWQAKKHKCHYLIYFFFQKKKIIQVETER